MDFFKIQNLLYELLEKFIPLFDNSLVTINYRCRGGSLLTSAFNYGNKNVSVPI